MVFFSQKKEEKGKKPALKEKKDVVKITPSISSKRGLCANILLQPMVTEKVHAISSMGQYAFFVKYPIHKRDIKRAVEEIYGVHVVSISTSRVKPKKRVRGKDVGYTRRLKKAIVSLRKGETIALFEGV